LVIQALEGLLHKAQMQGVTLGNLSKFNQTIFIQLAFGDQYLVMPLEVCQPKTAFLHIFFYRGREKGFPFCITRYWLEFAE
jgi:hypothetical protein